MPQITLTLLRIEPNTPIPAINSPNPVKLDVTAGWLLTLRMKPSTNDGPSVSASTGICATMPVMSLSSKPSMPIDNLHKVINAIDSGNIDKKL